jgi:putative redox protein
MATTLAHLDVTVERTAPGRFTATNARGGQLAMGTGAGTEFTPVELLLAAVGGCTGIDVDLVTSRRAEPERFEVQVSADKVRDEGGNRLADVQVSFRIAFPGGEAGDRARAVLPGIVAMSHDRLCTVSRALELGTPVSVRIE